jgi:mannose-6-phosphate isomerase-like protein (cupin superfamily)
MDGWSVAALDAERRATGEPWLEFQRTADLSSGLYVLAAGEADLQEPHTEDEVYVVVAGRARFVTPDRSVDVEAGTVLFVPAHEVHRFVDVTEELRVVVVFGPAEGSRA